MGFVLVANVTREVRKIYAIRHTGGILRITSGCIAVATADRYLGLGTGCGPERQLEQIEAAGTLAGLRRGGNRVGGGRVIRQNNKRKQVV